MESTFVLPARALAVTGVWLLSCGCQAASLSSLDNVSFGFNSDGAQGCNYLVDLAGALNTSPCGSGTATLVVGSGHPDSATHWAVAGQSAAAFGELHGAVSIAADGNYAAEAGDSRAGVQPAFVDRVTLTVPGLPIGTRLQMAPSFLLGGSSAGAAVGNLTTSQTSQLTLLVGANGGSETLFSNLSSATYTSATAIFFNGLPFAFDATMLLQLHASPSLAAYPVFPNLDPFTFAFGMDFANTLRFTGFNVTDLQGSPITGYTQLAESGTNYLALVPEPPAAGMMVGGLLLLGRRLRRRGAAG